MSIFRKKAKGNPDLSRNFKAESADEDAWCLRRYERLSAGHIVALTYDVVMDVYACGFDNGEIHIYGSPPIHFVFTIPEQIHEAIGQALIFPAPKRLICITKGSMIVWSLDGHLTNNPISTVSIPTSTAFIGSATDHSHALIPYPDGTVHTFDLLHLRESPTKIIPSPDAAEGVIMDITQSTRNLDLLAVATYGSIYLWKFSLHRSLCTFILPENEELRPVCLGFHPNEDILVAGLLDGRLVFWSSDEPIPLWITTIPELLGEENKDGKKPEPVFKLLWTASSGRSSLIVLGGRPAGQSRLVTLHFDATPFSSREQLIPQSVTTYDESKSAAVKDFILLPHSGFLLALVDNGSATLLPSFPSSGNGEKLAEGLQSMTLDNPGSFLPYELYPPSIQGQVSICSNERIRFFESLSGNYVVKPLASGGLARPYIRGHGPDPRLSKYDEGRLACVIHEDGYIRFYDISSKLLLDPDPLTSPYPSPIGDLSIDIKTLLEEPLLWASLGDTTISQIVQIQVISEALEVYAVFEGGQILVWKYLKDGASQTPMANTDPKLLDLSSVMIEGSKFSPRCLLSPKNGKLLALATSEVGFMAAAYENGTTYIIDMRGPHIIQERNQPTQDPIVSMRFAISGLNAKSPKRLMLLIFHQAGSITILTITRSNPGWLVEPKPLELPAKKNIPHVISCFLVNLLSGSDLDSSAQAFAALHSTKKEPEKPDKSSFLGEFYRITVSNEAIRCDVGFTESLVKVIEFKNATKAELVRRNGSSALLVFTSEAEIYILSIPQLQVLAKFQVPFTPEVLATVQPIKGTCDFTVFTPAGLEVWTISPTLRAEKPQIMLPEMNSEKQDQGPGLISWLLGKGQGMTGEQFDNMVGGPDRPTAVSPVATSPDKDTAFGDLAAATSERGELIGNLAKQTEQLEHAAEGMAAQAQDLARRQTKRRRFGL